MKNEKWKMKNEKYEKWKIPQSRKQTIMTKIKRVSALGANSNIKHVVVNAFAWGTEDPGSNPARV
jgi:hypothetical protein